MNYSEIEKKIGYTFQDKSLLEKAFIHSSLGRENNERLEYLGDAVLQLIVTETQYHSGSLAEGEMTVQRQRFVSKDALLAVAEKLDLKKYLRFEGSASNVGEKTVSSLVETVIAAIYLDGGYVSASGFVKNAFPSLKGVNKQNHKKNLQEYLQKKGLPLPNYGEPIKKGPDHAPEYKVFVTAQGQSADGEGKTVKAAEQAAAEKLLKKLTASR